MNIQYTFANHGFEIRRGACGPELLERLRAEFPVDAAADWHLGERSELIREAIAGAWAALAESILGPGVEAIQAILYNRTPDNNVAQEWHQDTEHLAPGISLLSLRVSLDPSTFADGGVKLCATSHKHGVLKPNEVKAHAARPVSCPEMEAGDVLLMHPLTIHASGKSETLRPRRVVHVVYRRGQLV